MTTSAPKTTVISLVGWLATSLSVGCGSLGGPSLDELNAVHPLPDPSVDDTPPGAPFEPGQRRDVGDADASFELHSFSGWIAGMALPGDLDADGFDDLVLYARRGNSPDIVPCDRGCPGFSQTDVYLVYGGADFTGALVPSATIEGWHVNDLRTSVDAAGDVDGDGYADLLVSIGETGCEQGNVFLVRGGPRLSGTYDVRDVGAMVRESATCARLGDGVGVGDLDGDGLGDYTISTPGTDHAYLFYGSTDTPPPRRSEHDADASFAEDGIGIGIPVGDVNGDGLADLVLGGGDGSSDRTHWLVLGRETRLSGELGMSGATRLVAAVVVGVGDLDGDGLDDLAATVTTGGLDAFVVSGRAEWPAELDVRASPTRVVRDVSPVAGSVPGGTTVAAAGDVDGDGATDLLYGVPAYDAGDGIPRGAVHLFLGPLSGELGIDDATTFLGQDWAADHDGVRRGMDELGRWIGGRSDLNGDGLDDLVLPAAGAPDGGRVYVWLGRAS
jgi:hypothetical protein